MGVADRPRPPSVGHARARARACAGQPTWTWLSGVHRQAASSDGVTLLELLEVVVVVGALVLARRLDDALELVAHLRLGVADVEPLAQPREHLAQRRLLEARVPRAGARDLNHREDHVRVPVRRHHRLHAALGVRLVPRRADAAHQRDVLGGELPRSRLDDAADLLARRVAEAEAKVDVEEVAERVDHQVAVVPVAQQQQPHDDRVSRQRLDEARLRREEAVAVGRPVPLHEEGAQRGVPRRLLEPVEVLRRGDRLDQARVGAGGLRAVAQGRVWRCEVRPTRGRIAAMCSRREPRVQPRGGMGVARGWCGDCVGVARGAWMWYGRSHVSSGGKILTKSRISCMMKTS
mmetsp:Transcript_28192/g.83261  ORF Transcript_28192/g.83261 Transcript_28192/m.83261 type:complete len:348 (+) Transcript_28192:428-1471(+)